MLQPAIAMPSPPSYLIRVMDELVALPVIEHTHVRFGDGMTLECGVKLDSHTVAYRTYGALNATRKKAVAAIRAPSAAARVNDSAEASWSRWTGLPPTRSQRSG